MRESPGYCVPILSRRPEGLRLGWLEIQPVPQSTSCSLAPTPSLPPISFPSLPGSPYVLPASKCPAQQIFETLQVNHKTETLPPPPLQTQRGRESRSQRERLLSEQATVIPARLLLMINNLPQHERERERGRDCVSLRAGTEQ